MDVQLERDCKYKARRMCDATCMSGYIHLGFEAHTNTHKYTQIPETNSGRFTHKDTVALKCERVVERVV